MRRQIVGIVTAAVLATVLAACGTASETIAERAFESEGDGDVDVEVDEGDGSVSVEFEDEDGGGSATFGGGEIPDDFPIPVPGGGTIIQVVELGDGAQSVSLQYGTGDFDRISDEFIEYFEGFSDTQTTTGTGEDPFLNLLSAEGGVSVSVVGSPEGALATLIKQPDR